MRAITKILWAMIFATYREVVRGISSALHKMHQVVLSSSKG